MSVRYLFSILTKKYLSIDISFLDEYLNFNRGLYLRSLIILRGRTKMEELPYELKVYIASFLDFSSLLSLCQVSRRFSRITQDNVFWQDQFKRNFSVFLFAAVSPLSSDRDSREINWRQLYGKACRNLIYNSSYFRKIFQDIQNYYPHVQFYDPVLDSVVSFPSFNGEKTEVDVYLYLNRCSDDEDIYQSMILCLYQKYDIYSLISTGYHLTVPKRSNIILLSGFIEGEWIPYKSKRIRDSIKTVEPDRMFFPF